VCWLNRLFRGYEKHEIPDAHKLGFYPDFKIWQAYLNDPLSGSKYINNEWLNVVLKNRKTNIEYSFEEEVIGRRILEKLGIPKGKQYVCFFSRDSAYLNSVCKKRDWSYHNYRDSSIQNYVLAAEEMVNKGYYAVRMGAFVKDPIHGSNSQIIDYATNGQRTDFNDIYIGSHCRFFISSDSGISIVPEIFRIPVVYTNWAPILRISIWALNGLIIPKKFYLKDEKRYMSFFEIMNFEFGESDTNEIFAKLNLELLENTPEEIRAVAIEMDGRLNGTWESTEEDEELQQSFWALFGPEKLRSPDLRIGAAYLRENQDLIS